MRTKFKIHSIFISNFSNFSRFSKIYDRSRPF